MRERLHRLLNRIIRAHQREGGTTMMAAISCMHTVNGASAWGSCQWRAKGTTPGYKYAGYYSRCGRCGAYAPC